MTKTPQEVMEETNNAKKYMEAAAEGIALQARLMKACYESLVDSGFNDKQALEITKARGPFLVGGEMAEKSN